MSTISLNASPFYPASRTTVRTPPAASHGAGARRASLGGSRPATGSREDAKNAIIDLFRECREAGADGYGSSPADPASFRLAYELLGALPPDLPSPDVGMDPDGEASLEWHHSAGWTFGVSVGGHGVLYCSGLLGDAEVAARARVAPGEVPADVVRYARIVARRNG